MRDVVNKNVTDEQLMETAERVFSRGWNKMKLYFMIGLPTEEDEDVRDIVRTGARALDVARRVQRNRRARVTVSVSTHVPKPHTPFQWCAMDSHEEILRKQSVLRYEAASTRVQLKMHKSDGSWLEGMLARGDRRLADVIQGAYRRGARFDSWDEKLDLDAWTASLDETGIDPNWFLGTIPVSAQAGLVAHRRRARAGVPGPGVPQGPSQPIEPAVRQDGRQLRSPHQRPGRRSREAPPGLLRLRRRLRPHEDERRAHCLLEEHERPRAGPSAGSDRMMPKRRRSIGDHSMGSIRVQRCAFGWVTESSAERPIPPTSISSAPFREC